MLVNGTRAHAEALRDEVAAVLAPMGLRLSEEKTRVVPHRRGLRLPRVPHPAAPEARHGQALRLHLPVEEGARLDQGQGAGDDQGGDEPAARGPAAPAQPGAAGLDQLLPARRVEGDLRLPARLHLAQGGLLAPPQAPARQLEVAPPALPPRVVADRRRGDAVRPGNGDGHPLPLPESPHRHTMVLGTEDDVA